MSTSPANRVLQHTGARVPIVQAPMGYIARSRLASAVSDAGGLGVIETSSGEVEACAAEARRMRELTDAPFGMNFPVRFLRDERMLDIAVEVGVRFVTTSAGSPAKYLGRLKDAGMVVYHVVPTVEAARKAVDAGVDGLVVEGGEGGGFKSPDDVSTMVLLPAVRDAVDVPLVAAGGIADGRGMAAAFALGAEAVQMGTRFLASRESPICVEYKQALLEAAETSTVMLNRDGKPTMRVLRTQWATSLLQVGGRLPPDALDRILDVYFGGDLEASLASAGQSAGLVREELSVAEIVRSTMEEFHRVAAGLCRHAGYAT